MVLSGVASLFLLVGRLLFGAVLAFQGVNHFLNRDQMVPYAEAKGVPAAGFLVPASGVLLVSSGLAVAAGVYAAVGAAAVAVFLLVTTPLMHDFWAVPEEDQQAEMTHFLKNAQLLAASVAFLAVAGQEWGYAVGVGLF